MSNSMIKGISIMNWTEMYFHSVNFQFDQKLLPAKHKLDLFSECLLNRNIDNKHLKRSKVSRSAMSTPEKHVSMKNCNGNNYSVYMNGSCDNLNSNKYYEHQDRSLKFLEKHKVVLLGKTFYKWVKLIASWLKGN